MRRGSRETGYRGKDCGALLCAPAVDTGAPPALTLRYKPVQTRYRRRRRHRQHQHGQSQLQLHGRHDVTRSKYVFNRFEEPARKVGIVGTGDLP